MLPLASPLHLLMAAPQLLASVIGGSPYARQILYQYTSVMIAPIFIASIEGARNVGSASGRCAKWILPWLLVCAYVTNVAWSPSPFGDRYGVWARSNPRAETMQEAVELVPDDAAVTSTFNLGPHLSRREELYDWPNPFWPAYWGNEAPGRPDCTGYPSASVVDYLVLDRTLFAGDPNQTAFIDGLVARGGQFETVMDEDGVLVARRVEPGPDGEELPINCPGTIFDAMVLNDIEPPSLPIPTSRRRCRRRQLRRTRAAGDSTSTVRRRTATGARRSRRRTSHRASSKLTFRRRHAQARSSRCDRLTSVRGVVWAAGDGQQVLAERRVGDEALHGAAGGDDRPGRSRSTTPSRAS